LLQLALQIPLRRQVVRAVRRRWQGNELKGQTVYPSERRVCLSRGRQRKQSPKPLHRLREPLLWLLMLLVRVVQMPLRHLLHHL
jgi:hypothetical protein